MSATAEHRGSGVDTLPGKDKDAGEACDKAMTDQGPNNPLDGKEVVQTISKTDAAPPKPRLIRKESRKIWGNEKTC